jgi:energy-coupling factor transporter ATP-binding protein EcfA2
MNEPAIAVTGLRRSFGPKQAVAGIDLVIAAGSLAGLVGPDGAGKTTSLSMMTGLLRPDGKGRIVATGTTAEVRGGKTLQGLFRITLARLVATGLAGLLRSRRGKDLAALLIIPVFGVYEGFIQIMPKLTSQGALSAASFGGVDP